MKLKLALAGLVLLLAGCVAHIKTSGYQATGAPLVQLGNKSIIARIVPTIHATRHGHNLAGRLSTALFFHWVETGPYALLVTVSVKGIENGRTVELTSAELQSDAGQSRVLLLKTSPSLQTLTAQRELGTKDNRREEFSSCELRLPLGDDFAPKAGESVRLLLTLKLPDEPDETKLAVDLKGAREEHWTSTVLIM